MPRARVCRYCGLSLVRRTPEPKVVRNNKAILINVGSGVAILSAISYCTSGNQPKQGDIEAVAVAPLVDDATRKGCSNALAKAGLSGLVRQRPSHKRVNVDELIWLRIPATEKEALLALVACDAFGKRPSDLVALDEYVVAYGWRNGKRLAMLTHYGVNYE